MMDRRRRTSCPGQTFVLAAALIAAGGVLAHVLAPQWQPHRSSVRPAPGSHSHPPRLLDLPAHVAPIFFEHAVGQGSGTAPIEQTAATLSDTSADRQHRLRQHALYGGYPSLSTATIVGEVRPAAEQLIRLPAADGAAPSTIQLEVQPPTPAAEQQGWLHGAALRTLAPSHEPAAARSGLDTAPKTDPEPPAAARPSPPGRVSLDNVAVQADALARHAFGLAERGALYSARSEFIQALRVVAQGLDTAMEVNVHSRALASGLRALQEADDFMPHGSRLEADLDLARLIAAHHTPVLQGRDVSQLTPVAALQHYYGFARQQLATAGGSQPAASLALLGLGKLYALMDTRAGEEYAAGTSQGNGHVAGRRYD